MTLDVCVSATVSDTDAEIVRERTDVEDITGDEEGAALAVLEIEADEDAVSVNESTLEAEIAGDGDIDADGESV